MIQTKMTFQKYIEKLKSKGFIRIGRGSFGYVYAHNEKKNVLKIFQNDEPYLNFIKRIKDSKNPYFPRIKSIRTYKHLKETYTIVKLERLEVFADLCISAQNDIMDRFEGYVNSDIYIDSGYTCTASLEFDEAVREYRDDTDKDLNEAFDILCNLEKSIYPSRLDCHGKNVMIRKEGERNRLVFIDPLWKGGW